MNLPEPTHKQFSTLIDEISTGKLKIPQFQRHFVWDMKRSAKLLDSIVKGYPVGTFIFWKTAERLRSVRNIGGLSLPEPAVGESVNYVLDGQQRLTSIFAALKGEKIERIDGKIEDFSNIWIDLDAKENESIVIIPVSSENKPNQIKITDLLFAGLSVLANYPKEYHSKIDDYKKRITSYNYSIIQVNSVPIDIATDIFTRLNVGGKQLSTFEIMVAKTYDYEKNFDLSEKYGELVEILSEAGYETISDASILQLMSLILSKDCKKSTILNLKKSEFIEKWELISESIKSSVDYFRNHYHVPVSQLLPYNALIVPFSYFFYHHSDRPTGDMQKYLQDFFWRISLSGRYSSAVESKLAQDIKRIDEILQGKLPKYDWPVSSSPEFIKDNGYFSAGRSYIKAILCIYASHNPKSFEDNSKVNIQNDWLKQANSKNYHHFFPKAFLETLNKDWKKVNHILNITIVDDYLNKRKIRDHAPSKYMVEFKKSNKNLEETMKTHLIDLEGSGIWNDDYDLFFEKRAELVSKEIEKRIIKQEIDEKPQADLQDDDSDSYEGIEYVESPIDIEKNNDSITELEGFKIGSNVQWEKNGKIVLGEVLKLDSKRTRVYVKYTDDEECWERINNNKNFKLK
ncbi:MAG: DUF262 domain-containing protein [archaeon]|jgi:hypothetical protein